MVRLLSLPEEDYCVKSISIDLNFFIELILDLGKPTFPYAQPAGTAVPATLPRSKMSAISPEKKRRETDDSCSPTKKRKDGNYGEGQYSILPAPAWHIARHGQRSSASGTITDRRRRGCTATLPSRSRHGAGACWTSSSSACLRTRTGRTRSGSRARCPRATHISPGLSGFDG